MVVGHERARDSSVVDKTRSKLRERLLIDFRPFGSEHRCGRTVHRYDDTRKRGRALQAETQPQDAVDDGARRARLFLRPRRQPPLLSLDPIA